MSGTLAKISMNRTDRAAAVTLNIRAPSRGVGLPLFGNLTGDISSLEISPARLYGLRLTLTHISDPNCDPVLGQRRGAIS